jgi:hypothetical protein
MNDTRTRWVHTAIDIEHRGTAIKITAEGKVILSNSPIKKQDYDEITVPASVIFRTIKALKLEAKQAFEVEHRGIKISVLNPTLIKLSNEPSNGDEIDEIQLPSDVIYKTAQALKVTRKQEAVND